jgi:hypothetical protein
MGVLRLQRAIKLVYSWLIFVVLVDFSEILTTFTTILFILLCDLSLIFLDVLIKWTIYNVC